MGKEEYCNEDDIRKKSKKRRETILKEKTKRNEVLCQVLCQVNESPGFYLIIYNQIQKVKNKYKQYVYREKYIQI